MRRARVLFVLALALTGVSVGHSPAAAQQGGLASVASTVADCWSRRDAEGIAGLVSRGGVALHLFEETQPAAGARQARAALSDLFDRAERAAGSARVTRVQDLGGTPEKGFAELGWDVRASGSEPGMKYTVFVGFVREDGGWRIAEIRVLR